ncbi:MaoC family dehydratase N-terminal domain-containing protein [Afifella sp. IM 167]|uniref:FAS1-like dehydratase domain-containing protein n=1 Tax=Afifella sp. IM 167 TaxID=2033586 RepID=UPI001CCB63B8|nr:MaoC family dehydratase N-terminal domain-containing protein [Afifella sp. IM 167]MBZ8133056.1 protein dehydratase [Afifella sp. IM 167]
MAIENTSPATFDLGHLRGWIGRREKAADIVTPRLVGAFRAMLGDAPGEPAEGDEAPPCLHWCLAPPLAPASALGPDGHPARGGFLPPVPLPRRMWAGGRLDFSAPLLVGETVTRTSTVSDIAVKEGRSGLLCFVTVDHVIESARGTLLTERQDIVYREAEETARPAPAAQKQEGERDERQREPQGGSAGEPMPAPRWQRHVAADPVTLFRYSALTFNGHRIHYDRRYAIEKEGYPGLVVHGPLQATWLVRLAEETRGAAPRRFSFRGVKPLFDGSDVTLNAAEANGNPGTGLDLWVAGATGAPTLRASANW